jgi:hypothetical protein
VEREQLEHLIRASSDITNEYEIMVVGSQSILGPIPNPPIEFKASMEADVYPLTSSPTSALRLPLTRKGRGFLLRDAHARARECSWPR